LVRVHLRRGELARAEEEIARVSNTFAKLGETMFVLEASFIWADIATAAGEPSRALQIIEEAERADSKGEVQSLRARTCLGKAGALLALDRWDDCEVMLDAGLAAAREQQLPYEEAQLLRVASGLAASRGDREAHEMLISEADQLIATLTV